jgi:hypothetical protein
MATAGFRDRLLMIGIAVLVCLFGVGSFYFADEHHVNDSLLFFAWASFLAIAVFARAFRKYLKRRFMIPFLGGLTIVHGLVCMGLIEWRVPLVYWFPVFIVELSIGAWAAYRFFGVIPSGDI